MEDLDHNIHLKNLSMQQSINEEEALKLLFLGDTNRVIAEVRVKEIFSECVARKMHIIIECTDRIKVNHRLSLCRKLTFNIYYDMM